MLSYEKAVFFSDRASKEYLDSLGALSLKFEKANIMISKKYYKVGKKNGEFVYSDEEPEKYESFLISNYSTSLRTRLQLSFIRFTREAARFTPYKIGGNMRPRCAEIHKRDHQYDSRTPYTFTYADE